MKDLIVILGAQAVGKMTVGQELTKLTGLKLFYNHMSIELVRQFFSVHESEEGRKLDTLIRKEIIKAVASSTLPGMILTYVIDFDSTEDREYIQDKIDLFRSHADGTRLLVVELNADIETRINRNRTEHRLIHKPSKRDPNQPQKFLHVESLGRFNSHDGEQVFENHVKIDNTNLEPNTVAKMIVEQFQRVEN
jgi:hypothetical protein